MNANLFAVIESRMPADRESICIEAEGGQRWTWADLDRETARLAAYLASLGLAPGARVAVQVDKSPAALFLYLATLRAGLAFLPLNTAYQASEIDYFIGDAEPSVVVCGPRQQPWFEPIAQAHGVKHCLTLGEDGTGSLTEAARSFPETFETVNCHGDDLAAILYTSGTTGRSKGAMLSHRNLVSNALTLCQYWRWRAGDVLIHALPIFHVHGLFVASHCALLSQSRMIWLNRFDPVEVCRHLPRASVFMGVPTMYVRLLEEPALSRACAASMRLFISGSAPLLTDTFKQFEERTGHRILERYGMSETVMLSSNPYDGNRVAGTVGLPLPGVEIRIRGEGGALCPSGVIGGIEVRGPNVFSAYWRMPEKTREEFTDDGWFRTGDVGQWDANGYLSIVGRSKDLIITGGYNVYPKEIEGWLDEIEGVFESAVFGIPHRDFGEAVTAAVVARPGVQLDALALIAELKTRIASFKVPKQIHIVAQLPRNQMGKVQKNLLRNQFGA
ncbi:MAG: hypothetical protein RL322_548 [Pseudomonadota bacterium]|jgi:malonyl-CoA/methylmalonyl-CoA synthetase